MGLHFASFVAVYTFLEPRKRQALTDAVSAMLQQHTATIDARLGQLMGPRPAGAGAHVASGSREQAADSRQQQQQHLDGKSQLVNTEVQQEEQQQRVLQELEKVHQQLNALASTQQQRLQQQQQVSSVTQPGRSFCLDTESASFQPAAWGGLGCVEGYSRAQAAKA